ncbi:aldo/keto reductase [Sphingomonas sp. BIUV-7]|uniref:Aldo/keto reductase n=1 Tax=Sphingomonas natans TaxID=3063330 RepID=A0ABT8YB46_9SPHN|nr:aldo/keto reductase [Sphingomonas sp. BIUV-7]MDO6415553.1 aldo/keto reductase [Sphingomonas sp. BIUV-7]
MTLPTRAIGPFQVSAVSLGCMNLNHAYGAFPPEDEAIRLLNRALDLGVTMLDTAALYGDGENERLVGKAVMHRRSEFTLASKCVLGLFDGKRGLDGRPEAITGTLEGALQRLGTDHIDLYYLHRLDAKVPIEDSIGALVRAKEAGKIGAIGISEMSAATLRRAHAVHPIAAIQNEYSPAVRNVEIGVLAACRELGTTLVAFSPVVRGLLAGAIRTAAYAEGDVRHIMPRFVEPQLSENLKLVDAFDRIAAEAGLAPAQLAIGWVLAQDATIVALPGTKSIAHLEEDVATLTTPVPQEAIDAVTALFPFNAMSGPRYAAFAQAQVDTETLPDEELA